MIGYMKNKGFIPEKFYNKMQEKKTKNENEIFILFFMINLLIIPFTIKSVMEFEEKPVESQVNVSYIKNNQVDLSNINTWINNAIRDDIGEVNIDSNNGEIIVDSLEKVGELDSEEQINIKDVTRTEQGKYKLEVNLNE
ncbi:hypothetical protein [Clostridium saccharobutylicum]|uniref:Uncharacterized protein n=1 Tax=Clostridium saccharobutylicum TaxID=169679 RepID=A0A1S8MYD0_CLOSA|nr:hypothetical protein [Clostridium saccharobutylicum]OOM09208.1 hypothetical protein CLOSAC_34880 [Clostridium saccharobutylicum]